MTHRILTGLATTLVVVAMSTSPVFAGHAGGGHRGGGHHGGGGHGGGGHYGGGSHHGGGDHGGGGGHGGGFSNNNNHYGNNNVNINVDDHHHHHGGYYNHYHPGLAIVAGMAIGAALTYRPPNCIIEVLNGITYCHDGLNWYQINGTNYIVVVRP